MSAVCPRMSSCRLFPLFGSRAFLRVWQVQYCEGAYDACVRFQKNEIGEFVPLTLLPNGKVLPIAALSIAPRSAGGDRG